MSFLSLRAWVGSKFRHQRRVEGSPSYRGPASIALTCQRSMPLLLSGLLVFFDSCCEWPRSRGVNAARERGRRLALMPRELGRKLRRRRKHHAVGPMAHTKPASSRAIATTATVGRLWLPTRRRYVLVRHRSARWPTCASSAGSFSRRRLTWPRSAYRLVYAEAASIRTRRRWDCRSW